MNKSLSIDHIIVVRFDILSKVAPDRLIKNGTIVYTSTLKKAKPTKHPMTNPNFEVSKS